MSEQAADKTLKGYAVWRGHGCYEDEALLFFAESPNQARWFFAKEFGFPENTRKIYLSHRAKRVPEIDKYAESNGPGIWSDAQYPL